MAAINYSDVKKIGITYTAQTDSIIATAPGATGETITITDTTEVPGVVRLYKTNQEVIVPEGDGIEFAPADYKEAMYYAGYATVSGFTVKFDGTIVNAEDVETFADEINDTKDTTDPRPNSKTKKSASTETETK